MLPMAPMVYSCQVKFQWWRLRSFPPLSVRVAQAVKMRLTTIPMIAAARPALAERKARRKRPARPPATMAVAV